MDRTISVTLTVCPTTNELTDVKLEVTQWQVVDWRASLHATDDVKSVDLIQDVIGMLPDNAIGDSTREQLRMLSVEVSSIDPLRPQDERLRDLGRRVVAAGAAEDFEGTKGLLDELPEPVYAVE